MVSIGGQIRPTVGDAAIQNVSGKAAIITDAASLLAVNSSGIAGGGVGGTTLSGVILNTPDGYVEFNVSGQKGWVAYWVSA